LRLGERENGTEHLEEAIEAFHKALKECTREKNPLDWASIQNNLGIALLRLGERESGTARLKRAVTAYSGALEVFKKAKASYYIEICEQGLQKVLEEIQRRKK
jgi:tetratricopeptide (TPR) repeat protein